MVRIFSILVGLFFAGMLLYSAIRGTIAVAPVVAEHGKFVAPTPEKLFYKHPRHVSFAHDGPFGKFDRAQLQRGFQVYKEVCAACHGLKLVAFRDLEGIGYSEGQIKTIATEWAIETPTINPETGEATTRKSLASDKFPTPYPNETAAKAANNGAAPPDLSLITKARHDGTAYVYSLLTGYADPETYRNEKGMPLSKEAKPSSATLHFNPYFPNLNLAMAPPLTGDGQVSYGEGAPKPTVDQMAKDVAAFLTWTAEPKLEIRKSVGFGTMLFLAIFTLLCWMSYQAIWAEKKKS